MDLKQLTENFIKTGLYLRAWSPKTIRTYRQAFSSFQRSLAERQPQGRAPSDGSSKNKQETQQSSTCDCYSVGKEAGCCQPDSSRPQQSEQCGQPTISPRVLGGDTKHNGCRKGASVQPIDVVCKNPKHPYVEHNDCDYEQKSRSAFVDNRSADKLLTSPHSSGGMLSSKPTPLTVASVESGDCNPSNGHGSVETIDDYIQTSESQIEINKQNLQAWVVWMRDRGLSAGGCNMYIRTMNSFCSWLKEEGHTPERLRLKLLKNPPKPLRGLSDAEVRLILAFRPKGFFQLRTWTLMSCLLDTGVRIEEALTLESSKIDLDNLTVRVVGKGNKERVVPISYEFRKTLYRFTAKHQGMYVFCSRSGHRLTYRNTYRDIKDLCKRIGVEGEHVHPHAFRHCFAVTYIRRGGDIYRLSRILGHASISTTQLYLRSMGVEQLAENHSVLSPLTRMS